MQFNKISILALALSFSSICLAKTINVLKVTSDYNSDTSYLSIETDMHGKFIKMIQKVVEPGGATETKIFTLKELERGVVLVEKDDRQVIKLDLAGNFHDVYGGMFTIDYLGNGITGRRDEMSLDLVSENQSWHVEKKGQKVSKLYVKANKVLGKVVGIDEIQTIR